MLYPNNSKNKTNKQKATPKNNKKMKEEKESYRPILLMIRNLKVLDKMHANQIQEQIQKIVYNDQVGFIPEMCRTDST